MPESDALIAALREAKVPSEGAYRQIRARLREPVASDTPNEDEDRLLIAHDAPALLPILLRHASAETRRAVLRELLAGPEVALALQSIRRAGDEVGRICNERWRGGGGWRTSIQARPDYDSDLIISDALEAAARILAPVAEAR